MAIWTVIFCKWVRYLVALYEVIIFEVIKDGQVRVNLYYPWVFTLRKQA
jgi:hypothetical protein